MLTLRLFRALRSALRRGRIKNKRALRRTLQALRWALWVDGPQALHLAVCQAPARPRRR